MENLTLESIETTQVKKFSKLLDAQDKLNSAFDCPEWRSKHHPFHRYIWVEVGEFLEHHGHAFHYKKPAENRPQAVIELVDILHFILSLELQFSREPSALYDVLSNTLAEDIPKTPDSVIACADFLADLATSQNSLLFPAFCKLFIAYEVDFDELFNLYMLKYTLNQFRIDNGVTEGRYTKVWDGVEDNTILMQLHETHDDDFPAIYEELSKRYADIIS